MPKMTWKKSPDSLVQRFNEVVPQDAAVERRSMFGYPCAFLGGHMFCGLFQDHFILRLSEAERIKFLKEKGAAIFEPTPGRPMKEYVLVPPRVLDSDSALQPWLRLSHDYVSGLPPKAKKPKKAAKTAKAPPRAAASTPAKRRR
jgi:TfoX/Sxy family transcriptional regulator of competence genes